ncbi:hypothetical protein BS47DRAFT_1367856 [Hydnum rufescens UP504]|uniref:Uncharacterized protein n=1 Tax=Hydnum rufescens UP504 TaxID=1448309 RepID=A0A9P6DNZ3_9AGAM|nr:hypothetical protein BS47DRAFT_1367856 [Hydnum rufescens UP504]
MIYSLIFAAVSLGPGIGASPLMASPPMMARDLNFGTCTNPRVSFSSGAFVPEDLVDFPHASVSKPAIIFPFICSQLMSKCGLHETDPAVLACLKAAPPAEALGAKGIAADTFNAALGFTTDFAAVDKSGSSSRSPARSPRDELARVPPPPKAAHPLFLPPPLCDLHLFLVRRILTFANQFPPLHTLLSPLIPITQFQGPIRGRCGTWMLAQRDRLLTKMKDGME